MSVVAEAASIRTTARVAGHRAIWLDVTLAGLLVVAAGLVRLPGLDAYTVSFPEGIRAEQLFLMSAGYRPCLEIFCNQGPLLFYALYPTYVAFGQTLAAVRSGVVLFSLVGVAATYWVGSLVAGRWAGLVAALLLTLSPTYLKFSRLALAEVPAVAPAILAIGAALVFARSGRALALVSAGLLLAFSLLLKPVTLASAVPVGLFVVMRSERRWRNVTVLIGVTTLAVAIPTVLIGFSEILEQVVAFRLRSRVAEGRGPLWNWNRILEELASDRAGLFAFSLAGTILLLARARRSALVLAAWAVASLGLLLVHTPLHGKHIVTLIPPAALLAGSGVGVLAATLRTRPLGSNSVLSSPRLALAILALGVAAYLATLPVILARDRELMFDPEPLENDPAAYWYPDVIATLGQTTEPSDVVVTDHPYLTFSARRLVPPPLVESSVTRVLASSLTAEDAIVEAERYGTDAALLWADKLTTMRQFEAWVDRTFVPVRVYAADGEATPTFYVKPELSERAIQVVSRSTPIRQDVAFEGGLRLVAFGLDQARLPAGASTAVNLLWTADQRPAANYWVVLQLRSPNDIVWRSDELPLTGLAPGTSSWTVGRTLSFSALVRPPRSLQPGEYSLSVRLYDPRGRRFVDVLDPARAESSADPKGLTLGSLTVLRPAER